jgi:hypothetical protein
MLSSPSSGSIIDQGILKTFIASHALSILKPGTRLLSVGDLRSTIRLQNLARVRLKMMTNRMAVPRI